MTAFEIFTANPINVAIVCLLLGLIIGSFLNVVIYRLPIMMEHEWHEQCCELLELDQEPRTPISLSYPSSSCPHCQHSIRAWENIPVISYVMLRGKCSSCKKSISLRYPLIELVTGLLSAFVALQLGYGIQLLLVLVFTWSLIAASVIDFDHQLLPDQITLPLLWLGLIANAFGLFTTLEDALWGAIAGYLSLWSFYWLFKIATGKEGMGYGDFKLLAALGAWMGWQSLPLIILLSSVVGAIVGISLILFIGRDKNIPIPFGPYLAAAGWISLFWSHTIIASYQQALGLSSG